MTITEQRTLVCTSCEHSHTADPRLWACAQCGAPLRFAQLPVFQPAAIKTRDRTIWRYRHTFPFGPEVEPVTLGEGGTPLVALDKPLGAARVLAKLEYLNPTGSFKDRGIALMLTALRASGVVEAVEDSSGNAGASFAAYAARAGIGARVFVPQAVSPSKLRQIEMHGATPVRVPGLRAAAAAAVRQAAEAGAVYASHAHSAYNIAGLATTAYELWEQLGRAPDWIICPAGQGTFLLGLAQGFAALAAAGSIKRLPRLVGVQALASAPLWAAYHGRASPVGGAPAAETPTLAEGIRISEPLHSARVQAAITTSAGDFLAVDEAQIRHGHAQLARRGFYVEPTSAVVWGALEAIQQRATAAEMIVLMLTGSGLKSSLPETAGPSG